MGTTVQADPEWTALKEAVWQGYEMFAITLLLTKDIE